MGGAGHLMPSLHPGRILDLGVATAGILLVLAVDFNKKERSSMNNPTEEQIRKRAHEIYMKQENHGNDVDNWLEAERELKLMSERDETAAAVGERKSTRRDGAANARVGSGRTEEFKKGF